MCLTFISLVLKRVTNLPSREEGPYLRCPSRPRGLGARAAQTVLVECRQGCPCSRSTSVFRTVPQMEGAETEGLGHLVPRSRAISVLGCESRRAPALQSQHLSVGRRGLKSEQQRGSRDARGLRRALRRPGPETGWPPQTPAPRLRVGSRGTAGRRRAIGTSSVAFRNRSVPTGESERRNPGGQQGLQGQTGWWEPPKGLQVAEDSPRLSRS